MANNVKKPFLEELAKRFGVLRKLDDSLSLYDLGNGAARIYIRYSKVHPRGTTFYGLRDVDLRSLDGHPSVICFLWDNQKAPLLIPYADYEKIFQTISPAGDGQFKVQVYPEKEGTELYIANAGRFNVEDHMGWSALESLLTKDTEKVPELSHSQVQTLLGSIGTVKGFDVWVPTVDRGKLDWSSTKSFSCCEVLPYGFETIAHVLQEIDVVWIQRGSGQIAALFEVEHSTPIYSGLLRFNDVHLVAPNLKPRFSIVANYNRRDVFATQLNRPTFRRSGLSEMCNFIEYVNVFRWHKQIMKYGLQETVDSR
jgi:hypothetical protein